MKRYTAEFREAVRLAVIQESLTLSEAALRHGLHPDTLRAWQKRDDKEGRPWFTPQAPSRRPTPPLEAKHAAKMNRETLIAGLMEDYLSLHLEAMEALKKGVDDPMKRVDAISRLSQALDRTLRALDKASPELSRLAVAKDFLEKQAAFVQARFPQHLPAFLEILEPFGQELSHHMAGR